MFCVVHKDKLALETCSCCKQGVCQECQVFVHGKIYCPECSQELKAALDSPASKRNPIISALASFILPGVGQIYNGQPGKGIFIFFTCWLILPWLYGVYDAYATAKKINNGEISTGSIKGSFYVCILTVAIVIIMPFLFIRVYSHYLKMNNIDVAEGMARKNLARLSKALEKYEQDNGKYPVDYSELTFANPVYIDDILCDVEIASYNYSCELLVDRYTIKAIPLGIDDENKSAETIVMRTGGILTKGD